LRHDENPFHPYRIQFPYSVKFSLAGDNKTHITIHTTSEEIAFARSKEDVLLEKELTDAFSKEGYIKHITNFVGKELSYSNIEECELSYTGTPDIVEMTDEELEVYRREVISLD
tara:strand:+ start:2132 stop:2473 length:342 start_codon:yes stop_codon:yes gene_type:complete